MSNDFKICVKGAPTGRTKCCICKEPIQKDDLRVEIVLNKYIYRLKSTVVEKAYYHPNCITDTINELVAYYITTETLIKEK